MIFHTMLHRRSSSLGHPSAALLAALGGVPSATGKTITPNNAVSSTAVLACIRRISQSVAMLPLPLYQRTTKANGVEGKRRAVDNPLYDVLHDVANPKQTAFVYREMQQAKLMMRGNAYSEIQRDGNGEIVALWPLPVSTKRIDKDGETFYAVDVGDEIKALPESKVMHLKGFSEGGFLGWCLLIVNKEAVALDLSLEEYFARFFGNGALPSGILSVVGKLGKEGRDTLKKSWSEAYGGLSKAHRVAVLEEGTKYDRTGVTPEEASLITGRTYQVSEIARIWDMPLHMLAELTRATFSNIEEQSLEYVKYTLGPWLKRWEQQLNKDLLTVTERREFYAEFLVDGLLRGDFKTRQEGYKTAIMSGHLLPDEARAMENRDPLPGGVGAVPWIPMNYMPLTPGLISGAGAPPETSGETEAGERSAARSMKEFRASAGAAARLRIRARFKPLIADAISRLIRREQADVGRQAQKILRRGNVQELIDWAKAWYRDVHTPYALSQMAPVMSVMAKAIADAAALEVGSDRDDDISEFIREYTDVYVERHNSSSIGRIISTADNEMNGQDTEEDLERFDEMLEGWDERPLDEADNETTRIDGYFALTAWTLIGITRFKWRINPGACPLCTSINGKTVGVSKTFVAAGETIDPNDPNTAPLTSTGNISHPPLHRGCICSVVPEV